MEQKSASLRDHALSCARGNTRAVFSPHIMHGTRFFFPSRLPAQFLESLFGMFNPLSRSSA
jgi:hypothetical protein